MGLKLFQGHPTQRGDTEFWNPGILSPEPGSTLPVSRI